MENENPDIYKKLAENTRGIYLDEAHHLGAFHTKTALLNLKEESGSFFYGATATPVHHEINLTELFEREHWSYLNDRRSLFRSHSAEEVLEQLSLAIGSGEITPFEDLYIIGQSKSSFHETEDQPLFIQGDSDFYVLIPHHYSRLAGMLHPIIQSNRKGFIVAASIAEADRLTGFLNGVFEDVEFEAYHSNMARRERLGVLRRSEEREAHYIVVVRALDEGVNLPQLSAYIDLNSNISVKQMVHRIGRVLRLYPGKVGSDILFLSDYRDVRKAGDLLNLLDVVEASSGFSGGMKRLSGDYRLRSGEIVPLSREELLELRRELEASVRSFWKRGTKPSLDGVVEILRRKNIRLQTEYWERRETDPELQNLPKHLPQSYGVKWTEIQRLLGVSRPSLDEVVEILRRKNIKLQTEYWEQRETDPELQNLPKKLPESYGVKWIKIQRLLGVSRPSLDEVVEILRRKNIKLQTEYWEQRKTDPELQNLLRNLPQPYGVRWSEIKRRIETN